MPMVLEIPEDIVRAMQLPEPEKQGRAALELACALHRNGLLPFAQATKLAGINHRRFEEELAFRGIPKRMNQTDVVRQAGDE